MPFIALKIVYIFYVLLRNLGEQFITDWTILVSIKKYKFFNKIFLGNAKNAMNIQFG